MLTFTENLDYLYRFLYYFIEYFIDYYHVSEYSMDLSFKILICKDEAIWMSITYCVVRDTQ